MTTTASNDPPENNPDSVETGLGTDAGEGFRLPASVISEGPGDVIGNYKLLQKIGVGGFGVVYMADQLRPVKRRVALKLIKLGMDTKQVVARFEAERQALALMDHPSIARVFDAGATESGRPYFVMELVRGVPITQYCDDNNLTTRDRLTLFMDVCHAVQHAHQKGIIHRDIKPSNVMITMHDDRPVPKVIDFGIAKATQQELTEKTLFTQYEQFVGTPAYMSPEQAQLSGLDIDTRSDIYALGVLLYELLTGKPPFDTKELMKAGHDEIRRIIREDEPPKPSTRLSTAGDAELRDLAKHRQLEPNKLHNLMKGDLDWIVMKALEKDRRRRYDTANGFALDIERHLHDEPVKAAAPSLSYGLIKYARRHRGMLLAASAVALALIIGTVVSAWQAVRANAAKEDEAVARKHEKEQRILAEEHKERALQGERRVAQTLQRMQLRKAEELLESGNTGLALAYLARVLRDNPANRVAAERVLSLLLQRRFALPVSKPLEHEAAISSAEFDALGKKVVTASRDGVVKVWDARTGEALIPPLAHEQRVEMAKFSPDGRRLLTLGGGGASAQAHVWSAQDGRLELGPLASDRLEMRSAEPWNPGSDHVLIVKDGKMQIWDVTTGKAINEPFGFSDQGFDPAMYTTREERRFTPDGRHIMHTMSRSGNPLKGGHLKTAPMGRLWDVANGRPLSPEINILSDWPWPFSANGDRVLVRSDAGDVPFGFKIIETATGQVVSESPDPIGERGERITAWFTPREDRLLTLSSSSRNGVTTGNLWNVRTGRIVKELFKEEGERPNVQFSPDGARLLVVFRDNQGSSMKIWDIDNGRKLNQGIVHKANISSPRFSDDGLRLIATFRSDELLLWDTLTADRPIEPLPRVLSIDSAGQRAVTVDPYERKTAQVWDVNVTSALNPLNVFDNVLDARDVSVVSKSGHFLVIPIRSTDIRSTGWADYFQIWDTQTGLPASPKIDLNGELILAQFCTEEQLIITATAYGRNDLFIEVWNWRTGQMVAPPIRTLRPHLPLWFRLSLDAKRIIFVQAVHGIFSGPREEWGNCELTCWDVKSGDLLAGPVLQKIGGIDESQVDPQGSKAVVYSSNSEKTESQFWDLQTGKKIGEPVRGNANFNHDGQIALVVVNPIPVRNSLGTVTQEHPPKSTLRLWDLRTAVPLTDPMEIDGSGRSIDGEFSPSGRYWVVGPWSKEGMTSGRIELRDGETAELIRSFPGGAFEMSPNEEFFASTSDGGRSIELWNVQTGEPVGETLRHEDEVYRVRFSPDSKRLVTASAKSCRLWDVQTGQPLADPYVSAEEFVSVGFTQDGQRVTVRTKSGANIWECPSSSQQCPALLPELAEALGQNRINEMGRSETVSSTRLFDLKQQIFALTSNDLYTQVARWFLADPATRTVSPFCTSTIPQYVEHLVNENTLTSLREAVLIAPSNGTAFARLAALVRRQDPGESVGHFRQAEFYAKHAVNLEPSNAEAWQILADIQFQLASVKDGLGKDQLESTGKALAAVDRSIALRPDRAQAWLIKGLVLGVMGRSQESLEALVHATSLLRNHSKPLPNDAQLSQLAAKLAEHGKLEESKTVRRIGMEKRYRDINGVRTSKSIAKTLIPPDSEWKWLHPTDGIDPAKQQSDFHERFYMPEFDDSSWSIGRDTAGPFGGFGYGEDLFEGVDIGTPVSKDLGKSAYFRRRFTIDEDCSHLELRFQRDDGIIVYLDGKEVIRHNAEPGPDGFFLPATIAVSGVEERRMVRYPIDGTLSAGEHILAISLHNYSSSSDLRIAEISLVVTK